ncbi:hypothetical protein KC902_03925 [Candidatus Kaiserbacteria bacterium]|nr:hypothetical protein [Candidatus Kaiserbacteria bacterium]USN88506.1 MAG: hypothetical protein H6780_03365 [Candidatus Nomurabacteria bacterium]
MEYDPFDDWCVIGIFFTISALYTASAILLNATGVPNETFIVLTIYGVWVMFLKTTEESFGDLWLHYRYENEND